MKTIEVTTFVNVYDSNHVNHHLMKGEYEIDEDGRVQGTDLTITPADLKEAMKNGDVKEGKAAGVA